MRAVIQRVKRAAVRLDGTVVSKIEKGLAVLLAVGRGDGSEDVDYISAKLAGLRVFEDEECKMNLDVVSVKGAIMLVSQFTLYGDCRKGRRPSFDRAEEPAGAELLYEAVGDALRSKGIEVATGVFRSRMELELVNDGPVTLLLDSRCDL